jgi:pilus assembly protein Flp/PilA
VAVTVEYEEVSRSVLGKNQMQLSLKKFWSDTQGQDLVEYALAAGMVAVAAVAAMPALQATLNNVFTKIASIVDAHVQ